MASHAGQSGFCALVGAGIGVGVCAGVGLLAANMAHYPFRMLWFSPLLWGSRSGTRQHLGCGAQRMASTEAAADGCFRKTLVLHAVFVFRGTRLRLRFDRSFLFRGETREMPHPEHQAPNVFRRMTIRKSRHR